MTSPYWVVIWSVPLIAWIVFYALVIIQSRKADSEVRVNSFAITGASLALVSFFTGWSAVESGYDWSATTQMSFYLLLTYPVAFITPLAGVGQAGILVWVISWAQEHDASIGMWPGYLMAWISTAFMFAGITWPAGVSKERKNPPLSDRLLTMTIRKTSGQWMPGNQALAYVISAVLSIAAVFSLVFGRGIEAMLLLLVCLVFVLHLLRVNPLTGMIARSLPSLEPMPSRTARKSPLAWVLFIGASFLTAVISIGVADSSFGSSGLSGEERSSVLVWGGLFLAIVIPVAIMAYRKAVVPSLPKNVVTVTVVLFSFLMLMAAIALSTSLPLFLSASQLLFLAGLVLVGLPVMFLQVQATVGKATG